MSFSSSMVSVIIVADRHYKYLPGTVNSVRQQICSSFEVLIISDAKSPSLQQWLDRSSDPRLRLFCQEDMSLAEMFNLGIQEARGEYIAFLQAGYLWHPHKLCKQIFHLNCYPDVGLVHSWLISLDDRCLSQGKILKRQLAGWVQPEILQRNQISYQSVVVCRSCFDKVGLFDTQLQTTADWDMWIRLSRHYQFMAIAEPLVYYRPDCNLTRESCSVAETDMQTTIEKAYHNAPKELAVFKNRSYAYSSLSLARQTLQHPKPDYSIAHNYCRQALEQSPWVGISLEFLQVTSRAIWMDWLNSGDCVLTLKGISAGIFLRTPPDKDTATHKARAGNAEFILVCPKGYPKGFDRFAGRMPRSSSSTTCQLRWLHGGNLSSGEALSLRRYPPLRKVLHRNELSHPSAYSTPASRHHYNPLLLGLQNVWRKFKLSAHLLLNWMLEEESNRGEEQPRILHNEE